MADENQYEPNEADKYKTIDELFVPLLNSVHKMLKHSELGSPKVQQFMNFFELFCTNPLLSVVSIFCMQFVFFFTIV